MEINKIHQGDCLELMKEIEDNSVDLVLTDPPYGITGSEWDKVPSKEYFKEIFRISKRQIIFGGHFMDLPKKDGWIIWDRMKEENPSKINGNDADFIWTSFLEKNIIIRFLYNGNIQSFYGEKKKPNYKIGRRMFSSQKPIRFIKKLIKEYSKKGDIILDCFMGSGTTAVACKELGRSFIGMERDERYIKFANKRLSQCSFLAKGVEK